MSTLAPRPAFASYLPRALAAEEDGPLARLLALYEVLLSGSEGALPERLLAVAADLTLADPVLIAALEAQPDLRYDAASLKLVHRGPMSAARHAELEGLVLGGGPGAGAPASERDAYTAALARLFEASREAAEPIRGIEALLDGIARYSDPLQAPAAGGDGLELDARFFTDDFVSYLARWVAVSLRQDWPESRKRRLVQIIVPLYKKRGTLAGIRRILELFVDAPVAISEEPGMLVGVRSTVSVDTRVGGLPPHMFLVEIPYGFRDPGTPPTPFDLGFLRSVTQTTRQVLDLEKPAHTDYIARYRFPGIVVGEYSTVQYDTLLWAREPLDITTLGV